ncbi:putative membrane protein [Propionispora sp. 2/2-37]|uniref:ECF transporter S component n=1 Tax=Propionispora sp. 2/2-37 TaxID=1677858 RepID=UPI0006BB6C8B|nr:ECF transporter S component [Propionispora sp. 2/2-37]CUH94577.1 putative membrane protein [Propionispora sp. 2/2-37]
MNTKRLVLLALFVAVSYIGANLKIMGTIAFDSMPGFLGALLLGPVEGAFIGAAGHFFTALLSGFPLSLPVHLLIMADMAAAMAVFGLIYRHISARQGNAYTARLLAMMAGTAVNGPLALLLLAPWLLPAMGRSGMLALLPVLTGAALLNIVLAFLLYRILSKHLQHR